MSGKPKLHRALSVLSLVLAEIIHLDAVLEVTLRLLISEKAEPQMVGRAIQCKRGRKMIFRFRDVEVDEECFELRCHGRSVAVQPQVLDVILFLVRSGGRLVTKDDLVAGPWKGTAVSDGALNQAILLARRALAIGGAADVIVTVHSRGFRFLIEGRSGVSRSPVGLGQLR
jgi:DNA-binding response OmpR family regulator